MKIQIITDKKGFDTKYTVSSLSDVNTLDSYDYNIIDFNYSSIWYYKGNDYHNSDKLNDLISLGNLIKNSKKSNIIYIFPINKTFYYDYSGSYTNRTYTKSISLRDNIDGIKKIINFVTFFSYDICFEKNHTNVYDKKVESHFYFNLFSNDSSHIIKSIDSEKIVSFTYGRYTYTTLNLTNVELIDSFIEYITDNKESNYPDWFSEIEFNNDNTLKNTINNQETIIADANKIIFDSKKELENNNYYKTLLFENGDNLVKVVFDILQQILGIDLSGFKDKKDVDFDFKLNDSYLVGEIKGVKDGFKNSPLSQLETNKQIFMEEKSIDDCKGILIINYMRSIIPQDREPVHNNQIKYAVDHNLLIITSQTLLKIYEYYLQGKLDVENFKNVLITKNGLLTDEWRNV